MVLNILHLIACVVMGSAYAYWMMKEPNALAFGKLWPFIFGPVILGLVILCQYFIEAFVAIYSGALFEIEAMSNASKAWLIFSALAFAAPMLGLFPKVGNQPTAMLVISAIAASPSAATIFQPFIKSV